jgi:predicted nucleic acid-binding protein
VIVLDAAALIDVVLDQPSKGWVLDQLVDEVVVAPAHQPAEVLSAVGRLVRAGELDEPGARAALDEAAALEQELAPITLSLQRRALQLQDRVRMLDGLYVALAEERDARLVTTDGRLARAGLNVPVPTPTALG